MDLNVTPFGSIEPAFAEVNAKHNNKGFSTIDIGFQPQIEFGSKAIVAFEAIGHWGLVLADWLHPPCGHAGQTQAALARVITLAEATHGARAACAWRTSGFNIDVWIKLRACDVLNPQFSYTLIASVLQAQAEPDWLVLEMDEQDLVAAGEVALGSLEVLSGLGFKIALAAQGAPIMAFDKRIRALFSHLKYEGLTALGFAHTPDSPAARAFTRRMQAAEAVGLPMVATGMVSRQKKSLYRQFGFTRYQPSYASQTLAFDKATKRLMDQKTNTTHKTTPFIPPNWSGKINAHWLRDVISHDLQQTHQSKYHPKSHPNNQKDLVLLRRIAERAV
ncbi:EAL domain-containing protein [Candidatus Phycosocius spiralis]|uniref:EAL domain-containing protein n=1 Tax=Candidatus Phycosocius spiralis TaxID=2815099 RepID=A0ABQ4PSZ8_9PROT|nr:EAL domain-containing protein [Candidatus Phycosocius spiralis]GIU66039.1 hypothetical protein PsB1_0193 [Candidatus Phycosocius spiralis]